jgi:hypothetical protein
VALAATGENLVLPIKAPARWLRFTSSLFPLSLYHTIYPPQLEMARKEEVFLF